MAQVEIPRTPIKLLVSCYFAYSLFAIVYEMAELAIQAMQQKKKKKHGRYDAE